MEVYLHKFFGVRVEAEDLRTLVGIVTELNHILRHDLRKLIRTDSVDSVHRITGINKSP